MSEKIPYFTTRLMHFVYEKLNTSRLIFVIGDLGINVYYYKKNNLLETHFFNLETINSSDNLHNFIRKYKHSDAKIIINSKETRVQHESLPSIGGLNKLNPVEKYCETNLHPSDIYSYKTYSIVNNVDDVWKAVILWTPITNLIEKCLYLIKENRVNFVAVFFDEILSQNIATKIAEENNIILTNYIYSVVTVSETTGIKIIINHGDNILSSVIAPYPSDKSIAYAQGVIEQNLSDSWLKLKAYIGQNELKKINVLIVPKELKQLMETQNYDAEKTIYQSNNDSLLYADKIYIDYFTKIKRSPATSKELASYYRYNSLNNIMFKPIYIALAVLVIFCAAMKFEIMSIDDNTSDIYSKYSNTNEEIRLLSQNFPGINVIQLADLYNYQNKLIEPVPTPFDFAENFIKSTYQIVKFDRLFWELDDTNKLFKFTFAASINRISKDVLLQKLNDIIKDTHQKFPNFIIDLKTKNLIDDATNINKPISITITATSVKK